MTAIVQTRRQPNQPDDNSESESEIVSVASIHPRQQWRFNSKIAENLIGSYRYFIQHYYHIF